MTAVTDQRRLPLHRLPAETVAQWTPPAPFDSAFRPHAFGAVVARHRRWLADPDRAVLAAAAGITAEQLAKIELGSWPSLATAFALADALGLELAELVYEAERLTAGAELPASPPGSSHQPTMATVHIRPTAFGAVVAAGRHERGYSPADLASRAGVDPQELENIERGQQLPTLDRAFALADALQLRTHQLLHRVRQYADRKPRRLARREHGQVDSAPAVSTPQ
jgi:transcriptional regulator with XRE-family HTH domain